MAKVYREEGRSGRSIDRPALALLRQEADAFDLVVVFKMSRLGRSARDVLNTIHEFKQLGCEFVFIEDGLDTSNANHRLLITVLAGVAEMEAENNAEQVRLGMEQAASKGIWQGGPTPFGYTVDGDGRLVHDRNEAETVTAMVDMILKGASTADVADRLNATERRPPRSGQWKSAEVRRHLRRPAIKGEIEWSGITIPAPPIVAPATWQRLQDALDTSSLPRTTRGDIWILSGRVTCSCGGTLLGVGRRSGVRRYRCSNHKDDAKGECRCDHDQVPRRPRWWNAERLETEAWQSFIWILHSRDLLEAAINRHLGVGRNGFDEEALRRVSEAAARLRSALVEAETDWYAATDRERHTSIVERLRERLSTAEAEKERLEGLRSNQANALRLRQKWLEVAERYVSFEGTEPPTAREQKAIYADLDVAFRIELRPRHSGNIALAGRSLTERPASAYVPAQSYISCVGMLIPSEMSTDGRTARPSP